MNKTRKCNICKQPQTDLVAHYAATHRDPNARFVMHVRKIRSEGAPQYGSRFEAWLNANGVTDTAGTIAKIEGR